MTEAAIRIPVEATNPGQFFASCALLEFADRLTGRAEGWFDGCDFCISAECDLKTLIDSIVRAPFELCDPSHPENRAPSMLLGAPFNLRIDWWLIDEWGVSGLKVWAGTMHGFRIAEAMKCAILLPEPNPAEFLNVGQIVWDPHDPKKKVEPFYFDARRGPNAHSRDVGFSANDLSLKTAAFPAVEFLCFAGLQRARPIRLNKARHYSYFTWKTPTVPSLLPAAVSGHIAPLQSYQFESWYRTGQKKHKAFLTAHPEPLT